MDSLGTTFITKLKMQNKTTCIFCGCSYSFTSTALIPILISYNSALPLPESMIPYFYIYIVHIEICTQFLLLSCVLLWFGSNLFVRLFDVSSLALGQIWMSWEREIKLWNNLKIQTEVFCSTKSTKEIAKAENLKSLLLSNSGFMPWRFLKGVWLNGITNKCVF